MFLAYHKQTREPVSAFRLFNDLKWIGRKEEDFIAPEGEIANWKTLKENNITEVKVFAVKESIDGKRPHFRKETNSIAETYPESEAHKIAKATIIEAIEEDKIRIKNWDNQKLSEFGIKDYYIEQRITKHQGSKIADVLVEFKEFHPVIGRGICFEVQLSPQKIDKTKRRTYDRAYQGYSVVWLWDEDLIDTDYSFTLYSSLEAIELGKEQVIESVEEEIRNIENSLYHTKERIRQEMSSSIQAQKIDLNNLLYEQKQESKSIKDTLLSAKSNLTIQVQNWNNEYHKKFEDSLNDNLNKEIQFLKEKINNIDINNIIEELLQKSLDKKIEERLVIKFNAITSQIVNDKVDKLIKDKAITFEDIYSKFNERLDKEIKESNIIEELKNKLGGLECAKCKKWVAYGITNWKNMNAYCSECWQPNKLKEGDNGKL
jgi:competence CoiA-like predicted nuclease